MRVEELIEVTGIEVYDVSTKLLVLPFSCSQLLEGRDRITPITTTESTTTTELHTETTTTGFSYGEIILGK